VVAYWAYALLAVPWIEPPAACRQTTNRRRRSAAAAEDIVTLQVKSLKDFFPPALGN